MPRCRTYIGAAAATVGLLALPAGAGAVTISGLQPCYSHYPGGGSQPISINLSGGRPGDNLEVIAKDPGRAEESAGFVSGSFNAAGQAVNAGGALGLKMQNVLLPSGSVDASPGERVNLELDDLGGAATPGGQFNAPLGSTLVTNLVVDVASTPVQPRQPRTVSISGTLFAHKRTYGFVTNWSGTRVLRRVYLGTGNVCGYTKRKVVVAPGNFSLGSFKFWVNTGPRLRKRDAIETSFSTHAV